MLAVALIHVSQNKHCLELYIYKKMFLERIN